jgi:hypothetical protein
VDAVLNADVPVSNLVVNGSTVSGAAASIVGSYVNTASLDVGFERLTERVTSGSPSTRVSFLEHRWTMNVANNGSVRTLFLSAYHTPNTEGDDFFLEYSTDGTSFSPILTISKTSYDGQYQTATLPPGLSGNIVLRVRDGDHVPGHSVADTLSIDHMYIRSQ